MKIAATLIFTTAALHGCAYQTSMAVSGDYRSVHSQEKGQDVEVLVYGDRTIVSSASLNLSFYDRNTMPIETEYLNGYYLFPTLLDAFYMRADNNYLIVKIDEKTRIYSMNKVKME